MTAIKPAPGPPATLRSIEGRRLRARLPELTRDISVVTFEPWTSLQADRLLATARSLREAAAAGMLQPLLRGKNLALLAAGSSRDAELFVAAATEMGAKVSRVDAGSFSDAGKSLQDTARLLGRLYDGVECQGLPAATVRRLGELSSVAVYDGVASPGHPTAAIAAMLGDETARRYVVQAALLATL